MIATMPKRSPSVLKSTWPLASYKPVERRAGDDDRRKEKRPQGSERRTGLLRSITSLLRL